MWGAWVSYAGWVPGSSSLSTRQSTNESGEGKSFPQACPSLRGAGAKINVPHAKRGDAHFCWSSPCRCPRALVTLVWARCFPLCGGPQTRLFLEMWGRWGERVLQCSGKPDQSHWGSTRRESCHIRLPEYSRTRRCPQQVSSQANRPRELWAPLMLLQPQD